MDDEGRHREIRQQEGGEHGDPLMPLLFSSAVHNALQEVQAELLPGEWLFAFLDDVYALSTQDTRPVGGQVVPQSGDPGNRSPREDGRVGRQCVEPRRPQSVGDPSGDTKVPSSSERGAFAERRGFLENHPMGP